MFQYDSSGHSKVDLVPECQIKVRQSHVLFQTFGTGIEKHWSSFLQVAGTSDDVTLEAMGLCVFEEAESRPCAWGRSSVYREGQGQRPCRPQGKVERAADSCFQL